MTKVVMSYSDTGAFNVVSTMSVKWTEVILICCDLSLASHRAPRQFYISYPLIAFSSSIHTAVQNIRW